MTKSFKKIKNLSAWVIAIIIDERLLIFGSFLSLNIYSNWCDSTIFKETEKKLVEYLAIYLEEFDSKMFNFYPMEREKSLNFL